MTSSVSILGCGWLGLPLGCHFVERGANVRGSTTTAEKRDVLRTAGITPLVLTLDPEFSGDDPSPLFESPVLVLNIPPPRWAEDLRTAYRRQVEAVRGAALEGDTEWILFASSTSVYPSVEQTVTEEHVPPGQPDALPGSRRRSGEVLLELEALLLDTEGLDATIVRLGGLYGGDRNPGRFLASRSDVGRPDAPVNLLHRDDAVGVFSTLIDQDIRGEVFNACADEHPSRQAFYTRAAEVSGLEAPSFDESDSTTGKLVSNAKLKERTGYEFSHPDPLRDLDVDIA